MRPNQKPPFFSPGTDKLAIVVLGPRGDPLTVKLFGLVAESGCTIVEARLHTMGAELDLISLLLSGSWFACAKFEMGLENLQGRSEQGFTVWMHRTSLAPCLPEALPYAAYIVAPDQSDVIFKTIGLFVRHQLTVHDLQASSYEAPVTRAPMLSLSISFSVPHAKSVADFRERLMIFCDEHNFDVTLEPQRS